MALLDPNDIPRAATETALLKLCDGALWMLTEVKSAWGWKYGRQRYISEDVYLRWKDQQPHRTLCKGLRHEHVVPRQSMTVALVHAQTQADVMAVLTRPIACVVTVDEDDRLPPNGQGWHRYAEGGVRVFDCLHELWLEHL